MLLISFLIFTKSEFTVLYDVIFAKKWSTQLSPGRYGSNFEYTIFKLILKIKLNIISVCEIALVVSTLVLLMA